MQKQKHDFVSFLLAVWYSFFFLCLAFISLKSDFNLFALPAKLNVEFLRKVYNCKSWNLEEI